VTHLEYDVLRRTTGKWIDAKKVEESLFGEGVGLSTGDDKLANLRGQLYQHKDGSGLQQVDSYDFKGVPKDSFIQLLNDYAVSEPDWSGSPTLNSEQFSSTVEYDAFGRPMTSTDPGGNVTRNTYDKGGALNGVYLTPLGAGWETTYVQDIHYNAKGQREAIWYGNNTKTSYTYDPNNYRLTNLYTQNLGTAEDLQNLFYFYDPVGNITTIRDDAWQSIYFSGTVVDPVQGFTYDAMYRLIEATGRELISSATFGTDDIYDDSGWKTSHIGNGSAVQSYTQSYVYDAVGNIMELSHGATAGSYTRTYMYVPSTNRLDYTTVGSTNYPITYDSRGNMLSMPHMSVMDWNGSNELSHVTVGTEEITRICRSTTGDLWAIGSSDGYGGQVDTNYGQDDVWVVRADSHGTFKGGRILGSSGHEANQCVIFSSERRSRLSSKDLKAKSLYPPFVAGTRSMKITITTGVRTLLRLAKSASPEIQNVLPLPQM
jgi:YD repeat-containing protein